MAPHRTNPGRVELYKEAGAVLRENRKELLQVWAAVLALVALLNVPYFPRWMAGAATGTLLTFLVCMTYWSTWYASGLGSRLAGTWAEEFTGEALTEATASMSVIPNLRFDGFDIDHVVVARHGVYAIETKYHQYLFDAVLADDVRQAARAGRTLRLMLTRSKSPLLPDRAALFTNVLVVWGKAGRQILPMNVDDPHGGVIVVGGAHLAAWLDLQGRGTLPLSEVERVGSELEKLAFAREARHAPASRLLRRLARVS